MQRSSSLIVFVVIGVFAGCSKGPSTHSVPQSQRVLHEDVCRLIDLQIDGKTVADGTHIPAKAECKISGRLEALSGKFDPSNTKIAVAPDGKSLANNFMTGFIEIVRKNDSDQTWELIDGKPTNRRVVRGGMELVIDVPISLDHPAGEYWIEISLLEKHEGGMSPGPVVSVTFHRFCRRRIVIDQH